MDSKNARSVFGISPQPDWPVKHGWAGAQLGTQKKDFGAGSQSLNLRFSFFCGAG